MRRRTSAGAARRLIACVSVVCIALALGMSGQSGAAQQRGEPGEGNRGQGAAGGQSGSPAGRGRATIR